RKQSTAILQSRGIYRSCFRNLRQPAAQYIERPWTFISGSVAAQKYSYFREAESAVPQRIFQHSEPHKLWHAQYSGVFVSIHHAFAYSGSDHYHSNDFAADPVWIKAAILNFRKPKMMVVDSTEPSSSIHKLRVGPEFDPLVSRLLIWNCGVEQPGSSLASYPKGCRFKSYPRNH